MADSKQTIILATDCGSTTTKAILIEKKGDIYRQTYRGEAPTTVEAPFEDVTRGVLNAFAEVEEISGRKILDGDNIVSPSKEGIGIDLYISTSSAGGGLQMVVAGAVKTMSAQSAQRAALGAGAIVMDVIASNDGRLPHEKIDRIRHLRPDMILLSGGTDGGSITHVVELAEYIAAANPTPRLGMSFKLPIIFAGNKDARDKIEESLGEKCEVRITDNIRPVLEVENLFPARNEIQELFLIHVMAQAPGYKELIKMANAPIMPTPAAVGKIMQTIAKKDKINIVGVDIGGATTDVFSVFDGEFNRTVSANLGMSYSVSNVLAEAGIENINRWIPFDIDETDLRNRIKNKMIRPTTVPQLIEELKIEHALAREALRLAFIQHKSLAVGLKGVQKERDIADAFKQDDTETIVNMKKLDLLVGSGGVLSHAPKRSQAMMMLIDSFQPEGVTRIAVDSIFMMPHLGVLSTVNENAASEVFEKDCLVNLGTCITVSNIGKIGEDCADYKIKSGEKIEEGRLKCGALKMIPLPDGCIGTIEVFPKRGFDVGLGKGLPIKREIYGGVVGIVLDARGRPIRMHSNKTIDKHLINKWAEVFDAY